jgi:hypothetical protein
MVPPIEYVAAGPPSPPPSTGGATYVSGTLVSRPLSTGGVVAVLSDEQLARTKVRHSRRA